MNAMLQVPFIGWMDSIPWAGDSIQRMLTDAAKPVSAAVMGRTGAQFFLSDGTAEQEPLLVRLPC